MWPYLFMIKVNLSGVDRASARLRELTAEKQRTVLKRAVVSTARALVVDTRRDIQEIYNLKASTVNDKLFVRNLSPSGFTLTGLGAEIGLASYGAVDKRPKGVSVRIRKDGETIKLKHAFQQYIGGVPQIFQRKDGAGRYPLQRLTGPSIAGMLRNEARSAGAVEFTKNKLSEQIARLVRYK